MEDEARLAKLAKIAAEITDQPVHEQFRILGAEGLQLTDINWENCNTMEHGLVYVIPTRPAESMPPVETEK